MPFNALVTNQGTASTCADIVFCIDATGSMSPVIEEVKRMASGFNTRVMEALEEVGREVQELRVRVVTFRDFGTDTDAMVASRFFTLPDEEAEFQAFVDGIEAIGGGDEPENALEALAEAMNSDWTERGSYRRHIIMLFTDASAIKLEDSNRSHAQYPAAPGNLEGLQDWWMNGTPNGKLQQRAKRLLMFAPEASPWPDIKTWNQVEAGAPVDPAKGCDDVTMDKILALIAKSFAPVQ